MENVTLQVNGMSCGLCVMSIEKALFELGAEGVVDLSSNSVTIQYDGSRILLDHIKKAIKDLGYNV
ncbi:cation transporter [Paenibacillus allorhizosphaerae]|uniref:Copper chaperone CopZ n=1 Tax=Paenibacillus allorhizosphaerae TaxID=2849866 RepID=A0ABM8VTS9_9BACL|nr:cation transporter [Paenibacillus allorhizosphaerae]CAG7658140.1 Copper chaperone CopZ [Paenibacillus allorhizosphaerae]